MTCVLALKYIDVDTNKPVIVLAADKMGSNGNVKRVYTKPKIFKNGDFYIGYTTSFYMGQLLQHTWIPPEKELNQSDDEYLFRDVIKSLHRMFENNDFDFDAKGEGTFILVYKDRIFEVFSDMSLLEVDTFASVGCGSEVMQGAISMYLYDDGSTMVLDDMLALAFEIVAERSCGVSKEYDMLVIGDD